MKLKTTPLAFLAVPLLAMGCANVTPGPQCAEVPAQSVDPAPDLEAMADAAVLLIERGKLMPLADGLRSLGPEPDPSEAAATIERVLRTR